MDRRHFLKMMGLGGTALLAPKPFEVISARMTDISGPPLHVGLCRFRELGQFHLQDVGIVYDAWQRPDLRNTEPISDLLKNWSVHLAARRGGYYVKLSQRPIRKCIMGWGRQEASDDDIEIAARDTVEVWIVPDGNPRFPLPPLTACVYGPLPRSMEMPRKVATMPVRAIRLERTRAIELGLALPSDPYEMV